MVRGVGERRPTCSQDQQKGPQGWCDKKHASYSLTQIRPSVHAHVLPGELEADVSWASLSWTLKVFGSCYGL
jgi:hypothetical protein